MTPAPDEKLCPICGEPGHDSVTVGGLKIVGCPQLNEKDWIVTDYTKPRGWWVLADKAMPDSYIVPDKYKGGVHVIEYSSYQAVCAERDKLKQDMHLAVSNAGKDLIAERDRLKAENEVLKQTLKHDVDKIESQYSQQVDRLKAENEELREIIHKVRIAIDDYGSTQAEALCKIREALEKVGKEGDGK
jgi:hypothetical protein